MVSIHYFLNTSFIQQYGFIHANRLNHISLRKSLLLTLFPLFRLMKRPDQSEGSKCFYVRIIEWKNTGVQSLKFCRCQDRLYDTRSLHQFFPKYVLVTQLPVQCDARTPQYTQTFHDRTNSNCIASNRKLIVVSIFVISMAIKTFHLQNENNSREIEFRSSKSSSSQQLFLLRWENHQRLTNDCWLVVP